MTQHMIQIFTEFLCLMFTQNFKFQYPFWLRHHLLHTLLHFERRLVSQFTPKVCIFSYHGYKKSELPSLIILVYWGTQINQFIKLHDIKWWNIEKIVLYMYWQDHLIDVKLNSQMIIMNLKQHWKLLCSLNWLIVNYCIAVRAINRR